MGKNGEVSSEPTRISNMCKDYFANVANRMTENIPKSAVKYLKNKSSASIFLSPVTHKEIEDVI